MSTKKKSGFIQTTGTRKRAIAKAVLKPGKGIVRVNNILLENVSNDLSRSRIKEPIILAGDVAKKVDVEVDVFGGGWQGQASAVRLAIARALVNLEPKLKKVFLTYDRNLLIADIRRKEMRKPNDSKARAGRQKSYR